MTGAELLTYMKRRLRLVGVTIAPASEDENALMDAATEGRDTLRQIFAQRAPILVREFITLEQDVVNRSLFNFPAATKDPLKILNTRAITTRDTMIPAAEDGLDQDGGEYEWLSLRQVRVGENVSPSGGLEVSAVLAKDAITTATAEAAIGAPVTCHRAIGKYGALLYVTADEDTDGAILEKQFLQEVDRLMKLYAQFDRNGGAGLRQAFLQAFGEWQGDTIY